MVMWFGMYKGIDTSEIPVSYLKWLYSIGIKNSNLRVDVERILDADDAAREPPPSGLSAVIKSWHRQLALDYHPDRGGSTAVMQALNEARDRLMMALGLEE